jgi:hypothetical protein
MARESNSFTLLLRYQAQAERHYRRAIEEFDRLKALRSELPNEPIIEAPPEAQAEQTETTSRAFQTNPLAPEGREKGSDCFHPGKSPGSVSPVYGSAFSMAASTTGTISL